MLKSTIRQLSQRYVTLRSQTDEARRALEVAVQKASPSDLIGMLTSIEAPSPTPPTKPTRGRKPQSTRKRTKTRRTAKARTTAKATKTEKAITGTVREQILQVMASGVRLTTDEIAAKLPEVHRPSLNTSVSQLKAAKMLRNIGEKTGQKGAATTIWKITDKGAREARKVVRVDLQNVGSLRDQVAAVMGHRSMTPRDIVKTLRSAGVTLSGNVEQNVRNVLIRNSENGGYFQRDRLHGRGFYKLRAKTKQRVSRVTPIRQATGADTAPSNETTPRSERAVAAAAE